MAKVRVNDRMIYGGAVVGALHTGSSKVWEPPTTMSEADRLAYYRAREMFFPSKRTVHAAVPLRY